MIYISSKSEYEYLISSGYFPLLQWRMFTLPFKLRLELQQEMFGNLSISDQNNKFYHLFYKYSIKNCVETGQPIHEKDGINSKNVFSAENVSHIISKGSDRRMSLDFRNANLIIKPVHNIWDFGTEKEKQKLNIYRINQLVIQMLKKDYNG